MLFLHALLCSLLATSTLGIPVPGLILETPSVIDGSWYRKVSEHHSFYLIRY